ncbi:hypothetical protein CCACVL1_29105, partial [Corchorus capsularis]
LVRTLLRSPSSTVRCLSNLELSIMIRMELLC